MQNAVSETTTILLPASKIKEGFNYRRRYDPVKMASLQADIRERGLLQAVTVRQVENGDYQLIAGGRRFKAVSNEFGPDAMIEAKVVLMTDAEATAAMLAENNEREDPSVIEDAEGASRMLGLCNGDRDEAARRLGWSKNKLDRRLAVMNAIPAVRDAYLEDKILVGHVEILAALRKEVQERVIQKILEAPRKVTVEELKKTAEQSLLSLDSAIFDRKDCESCQFNTGHQQTMFDTYFEGARCTNKECYESKTENELDVRRNALTETYQVVRIVRPGENLTVQPVRAVGPKALGDEQAQACRTCGDFGACVSGVPDKLGNVYKDVCFNKTCNDEKAAAYAKSLKDQQKATANLPANDVQAQQSDAGPSEKAASEGVQEQSDSKPVIGSEPRGAIREYREAIWRTIFKMAVVKLPPVQNRALLCALLVNRPSDMDKYGSLEAIKKLGFDFGASLGGPEFLQQFLGLDQGGLSSIMQQLPAHLGVTSSITEICGYLSLLDVHLENYWKVNETFFEILTKVEIDAVCVEIGLADACGKHYVQLKNGSKKDFIKGVLNVEGFEYKGAIPALMRWKK